MTILRNIDRSSDNKNQKVPNLDRAHIAYLPNNQDG